MANRRYSSQFRFSFFHYPVELNCNFVVDSTNGNGLGLRSLKTEGITNVFMNTSATPAAGSPAPAPGYIYTQFNDTYNRYISGYAGIVSPLSGSNISSGLTVGNPYTITSLGASTAAQWNTAGVPSTQTPAVGLSFIAAATTVAGGGTVQASTTSGVGSFEVIGDPNASLLSTKPGTGGYIITQILSPSGAVVAPTAGSVISLTFLLSNSNLY